LATKFSVSEINFVLSEMHAKIIPSTISQKQEEEIKLLHEMQVPRPKLATSKLAGKKKNEKKVEQKKKKP
jgi:hypothetical protein